MASKKPKTPGLPPYKRGLKGQKTPPATAAIVELVVQKTLLGMTAKEILRHLPEQRNERYVSDIRQRADFKAQLEAARAERKAAFDERLQAMADAALNAHLELMANGPPKEKLGAAMSILDRSGTPRESRVEQAGEVRVTSAQVDMSPFNGRSREEIAHYVATGAFPDGTKPVAE